MKFKIESTRTIVVSESEIPQSVTEAILQRAEFKELPQMHSSVVEDFLIKSINDGHKPETIEKEADILEEKIIDLLRVTQENSTEIDWDNIINPENENIIRQKLIEVAKELGASEEILNEIMKIKFEISESMGASWSVGVAQVARHQIMRKALDYCEVFPDANLHEVVKTLTLTTATHEAGHIVDEKFGIFSNRIPNDKNWNEKDNKSERFAEFWPYIIDIPGVDVDIRRQEKLIQVKKSQQVWSAIKKYNKKYPEIGIHQLFNFIKSENPQVKDFVFARMTLYGGNHPENYASPYTLENLKEYK